MMGGAESCGLSVIAARASAPLLSFFDTYGRYGLAQY